MKDLMVTFEMAFPKGCYLAEVRPWYQYINGVKASEPSGIAYVVASRSDFEKTVVKTYDKIPKITQEQLDTSEKDVKVTFKGFNGKLYNSNGKIAISATAEEVILG